MDLEEGWLIAVKKAVQVKSVMTTPATKGEVTLSGSGPLLTRDRSVPVPDVTSPAHLKISTQIPMLYPLLKAAERLKQVQGRVELIIEAEGISDSLKEELVKLLKDYGVAYEFE